MAKSGGANYRDRALAAAAVGLVCLFACMFADASAAAGDTHTAPARGIDQLADAPRAKVEYQIMVGELALANGDALGAAKAYHEALAHAHGHAPALAKRATQIALAANRSDLAYHAARTWARLSSHDTKAQRAAVRLAFVNKDSNGIRQFAPPLIASADSSRAGYRLLAKILSDRPDQAGLALQAMQKLAERHADQAAPQYALGRLALNYNRIDMAATAADKAASDAPDWAQASLLQAAIDVRRGQPDAAQKRVDALKGSARERAEYHLALARLLLQAGAEAEGLATFKRAVAIDGDFNDARYGLGLVALSQDELDTADAQFKKLYKSGSHADDAAFYRGVVAERRDHADKAIGWYKKVSDGDHVFEARVRTAQLTCEQGDLDGARQQLHALFDQYPDQSTRLHAVEGSLLVRAGHPKKAVAAYNKALENASDDSDLLYARALAYEKLGRIHDAEADLKDILADDDNNPEALNALGYMLTNHGTDYARAEDYIRKSLKAAPDNPAVLDSLGWVEYKRGHLDAARKHLEKAYKSGPDPEIAAHLGEVRWKLGDHKAARHIWHKAKTEHPHNTMLKQTIKRLTS